MSNAPRRIRHLLGMLLVALLTLAMLHASRFWPDVLNVFGRTGDNWLHGELHRDLRPFSIIIWGGLVFASLSVAQWLVNLINKRATK